MKPQDHEYVKSKLAQILQCSPEDIAPMLDFMKSFTEAPRMVEYLLNFLGEDNKAVALDIADRWFPTTTTTTKSLKVLRVTDTPTVKSKSTAPKKPTSAPVKREICFCMGLEHGLFSNCLTCGKVLCQKEGAGPCTSCATIIGADGKPQAPVSAEPVLKQKKKGVKMDLASYHATLSYSAPSNAPPPNETLDQKHRRLDAESKFPTLGLRSSSSQDNLASPAEPNTLKAANAQRDRLLAFDRTDAIRSRIHDNSEDYSSAESDIWKTPAERALVKKAQLDYETKVEEQKRQNFFTLDMRNNRFVSETLAPVDKPDFGSLDSIAKPKSDAFSQSTLYIDEGPVKYIPSAEVQKSLKKSSGPVRKSVVLGRFEDDYQIDYGANDDDPVEPDWEE